MILTRVSTLAAAAALALGAAACSGRAQSGSPTPTPASDVTTISLPSLSPEEIANIKNLMFADMTLPEFMRGRKTENDDARAEAERSLLEAAEALERGRRDEAKRALKHLLERPELETRMRLVIWNTLRQLGERPPPGEADRVQGVVCELHNEAGVGTLAVYADGGVRWVGGQGKVSVIDLPGEDATLDALVRDLLKSGEPFVSTFPVRDRRLAGVPSFEYLRVTVLTYAGLHVGEFYGPGVEVGHIATPVLYASGLLVGEAIPAFEAKHQATHQPPAPAR